MIKKEVLEIRKQFTPENCAITRICGCYVDAEKNIRTTFKNAFLCLPEDEIFKYFEIFRKSLSGSIGKNLLNLEFWADQEREEGAQGHLLKLRDSALKDDDMLDEFYDKVVQSFEYGENYYIVLIHAVYDIPGRTKDGRELQDSSEDVYEYLLCSICPVKLSKAGLCYNIENNCIQENTRNWIVEAPMNGFLFPAFNDRNADIHSTLFYSKNPDKMQEKFIEQLLGCEVPLSAQEQQISFNAIVEEVLDKQCDYDAVRNIHERLNEILEEHKDEAQPSMIDKFELKKLLGSLIEGKDELESFNSNFDFEYNYIIGEKNLLLADNIASPKKFEIKTADIMIQVDPDRVDLVEARCMDGKNYLVIEVDDQIEVNGITAEMKKIR